MKEGQYIFGKDSNPRLSLVRPGNPPTATPAAPATSDGEDLMPYGQVAKAIYVKAHGLLAYHQSWGRGLESF